MHHLDALLDRSGRALARAPRRALALLALLAVGLITASLLFGSDFDDSNTTPDSGSEAARELLTERFPERAGDTSLIVVQAPDGALSAGGAPAVLVDLRRELAEVESVVAVSDPRLSQDGSVALLTVAHDGLATDLGVTPGERLTEIATATATESGLRVELRGPVVDVAAETEPPTSEIIGLLVAVITLTVLFRSLLSMALTLAVALAGVVAGLLAVPVLAGVIAVPEVAVNVGLLLGLGVGIDYALLLTYRHRRELAAGSDPVTAAGTAQATAGRAVLEAGSIVVLAISTLLLTGIPFVSTLGLAAGLVVVCAVIGALTGIPSLLGLAGTRLAPKPRAARTSPTTVRRVAEAVSRRPLLSALSAVAVLLALAAPALGLRLSLPDDGSDPDSSTQRQAFDLVSESFGPGANGPLVLAARLSPGQAPRLESVVAAVAADPLVAAVAPATLNASGDAAVITVVPRSSPDAAETQELVDRLRGDVLPASAPGLDVRVGGATAASVDLAARIGDRLPLFLTSVVLLAMAMLGVMFRSLWIPVVSALFNLLSIGAAYGVLVAVFQTETGAALVGLDRPMATIAFIPLIMFAILFGLSMDYNIFQLSRSREDIAAGLPAREAVLNGVSETARVIAAAAIVMIAVFGAFVLNPDPVLKQLGLGLASAVLVDVALVRLVLSPAVMQLLGERAWRLPQDRPRPRPATPADLQPVG